MDAAAFAAAAIWAFLFAIEVAVEEVVFAVGLRDLAASRTCASSSVMPSLVINAQVVPSRRADD